MEDKTHGAQGCVHWLAHGGSVNPAHTVSEPMIAWRSPTNPCGLNANNSYASTESGLALPTCCQVGIETDPKHSMPTVRSSASGGCHATSCPIKGQGKGKESQEKKGVKKRSVSKKTKQKVKNQIQFYVILVQNTLIVTGFDWIPTLFEYWGCEMALTVSELSKGLQGWLTGVSDQTALTFEHLGCSPLSQMTDLNLLT